MIKAINGYKNDSIFDTQIMMNLFLFLRYLPLIILSSDWILMENFGLFAFWGKLTLGNLLKKLQINFLFSIIFYCLFLFLLIIVITLYIIKKKQKIKGPEYKKSVIKLFVNILVLIFYLFPNYVLELCFINSINLNERKDGENKFSDIVFTQMKFNDISISIAGIIFSSIILVFYFILNFNFEKYLVSPHAIKYDDLKGNAIHLNLYFILLPILQGIMFLDFILNTSENYKLKIYIKLIFRIIYMISFLMSIRNFNKNFPYYTELFILNFTFFLCCLDFLFVSLFINQSSNTNSIAYLLSSYNLTNKVHNFYSNSTIASFNLNFYNTSLTSNNTIINDTFISKYSQDIISTPFFYDKSYDSFFINNTYEFYFSIKLPVLKILLSVIFSFFALKIIEEYEIKYFTSFYENSKKNIFVYYNKLFYFLYNLDNLSSHYVNKVITYFLINLKYHNFKCRVENCNCARCLSILKDIILIKKLDNQQIVSIFSKFISYNIKHFYKSNKSDTDNLNKFEMILIETLFGLYFKGTYITAFFNIDKLKRFNLIKSNSTAQTRLNMLKLEIIQSFLDKYKSSKLKKFRYLYSNYGFFNKFKDLQEKSERCFEFYKFMISKFADFNTKQNSYTSISNYSNFNSIKNINKNFKQNFRNFSHTENFFSYSFPEFERDLRMLKNLIYSTNEDLKDMINNKSNFNPIYFKNISMFTKFFLNKDLFRDIYLNNLKVVSKTPDLKSAGHNHLNEEDSEDRGERFFLNEIKKMEETEWDNVIIRNNKNNVLVFEKVSSRFSQDLGYKNNEIIGMELNSLIPFNFVEYHHNHVLNFLRKSNLIVENKEVYFTARNGFCLNYIISGTMILTLNEEVLIFCELKKVSSLIEKYNEKAFMSCELTGDIMAYDYGVFHHFYLDSYTINILKPNVFKNLLNINANTINYNLDTFIMEFEYKKILRNIQNLDLSKIIDVKSKEFEVSISRKISNAIEHTSDGKILIKFVKRNLLKTFFFYDVRIDLSQIKRLNFILNVPFVFGHEVKKPAVSFTSSRESVEKVSKERVLNKKILENIKILSLNNGENKNYIYEHIKIYEKIANDFFDFNSNIKGLADNNPLGSEMKIKNEKYDFKEVSKFVSKNNKIYFIEKSNKLNFYKQIIMCLIFLIFYVVAYFFVNLQNDDLYSKAQIFIDFHLNTVIIKSYMLNLSNSFFSIFFLLNNFEPTKFSFSSQKGGFIGFIDNSINYHYYQITNKTELLLDNTYFFQSLYSQYGSYLLQSNNNINDVFRIKKLNSDWSVTSQNYSLYQNMYLFHYICNRIKLDEIEKSKYLFFNYTENNFHTTPSETDLSLFFFMENVLGDFTLYFDDLIKYEEESFDLYQKNQRVFIFVIYFLSGLVAIIYIIFLTVQYYFEFIIIYTKYFILFNQLKVYYVLLYRKINNILLIFNDFTEENVNKIKMNTSKKLLKSNFTAHTIINDEIDLNKINENLELNDLENLNKLIEEGIQEGIIPVENQDFLNKNINLISKKNSFKALDVCKEMIRKRTTLVSTFLSSSSVSDEPLSLNPQAGDSKIYNNSKYSNLLANLFHKYQKRNQTKSAQKKSFYGNKLNINKENQPIHEINNELKEENSDFSMKDENDEQIFQDQEIREGKKLGSSENEKYIKSLIVPDLGEKRKHNFNNNDEQANESYINNKLTQNLETEKSNNHTVNTNNRLLLTSTSNNYINNLNTEDKMLTKLNNNAYKAINQITDMKNKENQLRQKNLLKNATNLNNKDIKEDNLNNNDKGKKTNVSKNNKKGENVPPCLPLGTEFDNEGDNLISFREFFVVPSSFKFTIKILVSFIILVLISSISIFLFILSAYDSINTSYIISRNFLSRYIYLNELFLVYRWSIVNKKEFKYTYKNGTKFDLFENSKNNYDQAFKYIESIKISSKLVNEFESFKILEDRFNTKNICDYYGYYMTKQNSTQDYEKDFKKYQNDCVVLSGGLNSYGITNSFTEMSSEIQKHYKDFVNFIHSQEGVETIADQKKFMQYVYQIFSDDRFQKIFINLNDIFFNINQLYFKNVVENHDILIEEIAVKHDWIHYNLFGIVVIALIIYLIIIYFKIKNPLSLIDSSENFVNNSIIYNIFDL